MLFVYPLKTSDATPGDPLQLARAGDRAAFDTLVEQHTPRLYRVVWRLASDRLEVEAVVQDAWLRAWKARASLPVEKEVFPWLARIAVNVAHDVWRKHRPLDFTDASQTELDFPGDAPGPERMLEDAQALEWLAKAVDRLKPEYRTVIALRYDAGLSYEDIARTLGLPVNTVRTHLHRAKAALRMAWEETDERSSG
jgi:RNA polymerase sigma-70 factor (ECF subfamily)